MQTLRTRSFLARLQRIVFALVGWLALGVVGAVANQTVAEEPELLESAAMQELVGPVALYPDDLLAIVLPASAYPLQIVEASRFLQRRETEPNLQPDADWDDAVIALLNYPEVLALLNADLDWTWRLGEAVVNQQEDVLAAVSAFRDAAYSAGNLRSDEHQIVEHEDSVLAVKPVEKEVIYVPYYQPREVIVYQSSPVYHYYPYRRPVYYYPYGNRSWFGDSAFWGVSSFFYLGWQTHHLHVYQPVHHRHPYFGREYRRGLFRSHHLNRHQARDRTFQIEHPRWRARERQRLARHSWQGSRPESGRHMISPRPQRDQHATRNPQYSPNTAPDARPETSQRIARQSMGSARQRLETRDTRQIHGNALGRVPDARPIAKVEATQPRVARPAVRERQLVKREWQQRPGTTTQRTASPSQTGPGERRVTSNAARPSTVAPAAIQAPSRASLPTPRASVTRIAPVARPAQRVQPARTPITRPTGAVNTQTPVPRAATQTNRSSTMGAQNPPAAPRRQQGNAASGRHAERR